MKLEGDCANNLHWAPTAIEHKTEPDLLQNKEQQEECNVFTADDLRITLHALDSASQTTRYQKLETPVLAGENTKM